MATMHQDALYLFIRANKNVPADHLAQRMSAQDVRALCRHVQGFLMEKYNWLTPRLQQEDSVGCDEELRLRTKDGWTPDQSKIFAEKILDTKRWPRNDWPEKERLQWVVQLLRFVSKTELASAWQLMLRRRPSPSVQAVMPDHWQSLQTPQYN